MIIGNFHYDKKNDIYTGSIKTLTFDHAGVELRPVSKSHDREPDYRVVQDDPTGLVEFGAAWRRRSDKGQTFVSVLLHDPALGQALSLALFDDQDGPARLVWSRPRAKAEEPQPHLPASDTKPKPQARRARLG